MILISEMEQQIIEKSKGKSQINFGQDKANISNQKHTSILKKQM